MKYSFYDKLDNF